MFLMRLAFARDEVYKKLREGYGIEALGLCKLARFFRITFLLFSMLKI